MRKHQESRLRDDKDMSIIRVMSRCTIIDIAISLEQAREVRSDGEYVVDFRTDESTC